MVFTLKKYSGEIFSTALVLEFRKLIFEKKPFLFFLHLDWWVMDSICKIKD